MKQQGAVFNSAWDTCSRTKFSDELGEPLCLVVLLLFNRFVVARAKGNDCAHIRGQRRLILCQAAQWTQQQR